MNEVSAVNAYGCNPATIDAAPQLAAGGVPKGLDFHLEDRAGIRVLVYHSHGCRPASDPECALWDALLAAAPTPEGRSDG